MLLVYFVAICATYYWYAIGFLLVFFMLLVTSVVEVAVSHSWQPALRHVSAFYRKAAC
jgi:hypothetical protein